MKVKAGTELAPVEVPITTTLIVAGALASRDFQEVHHDSAIAQDSGAKDIFMNILTTQGLVGRFVTDWAGPDTFIRSMKIRLGAPNYAGDMLTLTGHVESVEGDDVTVNVRGTNGLGEHVTGTVGVTLS